MLKFHNFINNRKMLIGLILASVLVLISLVGIWIWLSRSEKPPQMEATQPPTQQTGEHTQTDDPSAPSGATTDPSGTDSPGSTELPSAPAQSDSTESTPSGSPTNTPSGGSTKPSGSGTPPQSNNNSSQESQTQSPEQSLLTYDRFSLYSGQYVEDGRDEPVSNVAAILVTNRSDQFLDLATLTFEIDGREATFRVSGLPAGRSAWVMEANRMTATNSSVFTFVDMVTGFRENVISSTDKLSITCVGNLVTATNKSNQKLENVFVYYRVLHTDGNYLGGITYVIDFGTLEPGASVEKLAGHFSADKARIVRVGWSGQ